MGGPHIHVNISAEDDSGPVRFMPQVVYETRGGGHNATVIIARAPLTWHHDPREADYYENVWTMEKLDFDLELRQGASLWSTYIGLPSDGDYVVRVVAEDAYGNTTIKDEFFTLDFSQYTPSMLEIVSPEEGTEPERTNGRSTSRTRA